MAKWDHDDLKSTATDDYSRRISSVNTKPISATEAKEITDAQYAVHQQLLKNSLEYAYNSIRAQAARGFDDIELESYVWCEGPANPKKSATFTAAAKDLLDRGFKVNYLSNGKCTKISWG